MKFKWTPLTFTGAIILVWATVIFMLYNTANGFPSFKPDIKVGDVYQRVKVAKYASDPDEVTVIEITEISKDGDDVRYIYKMIDNKPFHNDDPHHWNSSTTTIYKLYEKLDYESNAKADRTM